MKERSILVVAVAIMFLPWAAQAQETDWVVDATLSSGGSITGSFVYDPTRLSGRGYSNIELTAVSGLLGNDSSFMQLEDAGPNGFLILNNDTTTAISLSWGTPLTNTLGDTFHLTGAYETFLHSGPYDPIVAGTVTSVPEPGTLPLLCISLLMLGVKIRENRRLRPNSLRAIDAPTRT